MKNIRFQNWAVGTIISVLVFPAVLKWVLSLFDIRSLTFMEAWGIISLVLVLVEGYRLAKLPTT